MKKIQNILMLLIYIPKFSFYFLNAVSTGLDKYDSKVNENLEKIKSNWKMVRGEKDNYRLSKFDKMALILLCCFIVVFELILIFVLLILVLNILA